MTDSTPAEFNSSSEPGALYSSPGLDRRRTIRIRRSALLEAKLDGIDKPSIKLAETKDEYMQSFAVLHDVYSAAGYLDKKSTHGVHFNIYHLLPKTSIFIFKSYLKVLSTISYIPDVAGFGLPIDELYKAEVDSLRDKGRSVVEIGSLATIPNLKWNNIMMLLSKAVFQYAILTGADDLCIMVNPKHVRFYKSIFLFDIFGPERHYEKVNAPAVALRANMRNMESSLYRAYHSQDFETDLHAFFVKINYPGCSSNSPVSNGERNIPLDPDFLKCLFSIKPEVLEHMTTEQRAFFSGIYGSDVFALKVHDNSCLAM